MCCELEKAVREEDLLGPLTAAYLRWLLGESMRLHASGVLFMSREGGFFLKAWERMGFSKYLRAAHLECSRDSLRAALDRKDQEEAFYLCMKGFDMHGLAVLADLGWGGTMQMLLTEFADRLGMDIRFEGRYMGLSESAAEREREGAFSARGFLFDALHDPPHPGSRDFYTPEAPFIGLFESLFLEMKGSVIGYRILPEGKAMPERRCCEFRTDAGTLLPEGRMILRLQEKALENMEKEKREISAADAFAPLLRLGMEPTLSEARLYGRIPFLDQGRVFPLARPRPWIVYLACPTLLTKDFRESRWKMGFLRCLLGGSRSWKRLYDLCRCLYRMFQRKEKQQER